MYMISHELDGQYRCTGTLQDGTETRYFHDLDNAVKWLVEFARFMNHDDIMPSDIHYYQARRVESVDYDREPLPNYEKQQNLNNVRQ